MINTPVDRVVKQDLAEAARRAQPYNARKSLPAAVLRRQKRADLQLFLELLLNIAVTYGLVYRLQPAWLKIALLLPWSIYSALSADNVMHYMNHWPLSRREPVNVLIRALHLPLVLAPLEIRYIHWEHHKYNDIEIDQETWLRQIAGRARGPGVSVLVYAVTYVFGSLAGGLPWSELPPFIQKLKRSRPAHYAEIVATRWAQLGVLGLLVAWRPFETLCFFIPAMVVLPHFAALLMNLTDHLPSTLTHPFRQATYLEPRTWRERFLAAVNRQSAATHLTHHLFPQVHWTQLRELQRELLPIYERHQAPRSHLLTTVLLGNWLEFLRLYHHLGHVCRQELDASEPAPEVSAPFAPSA